MDDAATSNEITAILTRAFEDNKDSCREEMASILKARGHNDKDANDIARLVFAEIQAQVTTGSGEK